LLLLLSPGPSAGGATFAVDGKLRGTNLIFGGCVEIFDDSKLDLPMENVDVVCGSERKVSKLRFRSKPIFLNLVSASREGIRRSLDVFWSLRGLVLIT
jgi:hypothetical protein